MIKNIILVLALFGTISAHAAEFKFTNAEADALYAALRRLDGIDQAFDQGAGNPKHVVIKAPYKFTREVRAKIAANLTALSTSVRIFGERDQALRLEAQVDYAQAKGDIEKAIINRDSMRRVVALAAEVAPAFELSYLTLDDLNLGKGDGENPIPGSVLEALNLIRAPVAK